MNNKKSYYLKNHEENKRKAREHYWKNRNYYLKKYHEKKRIKLGFEKKIKEKIILYFD